MHLAGESGSHRGLYNPLAPNMSSLLGWNKRKNWRERVSLWLSGPIPSSSSPNPAPTMQFCQTVTCPRMSTYLLALLPGASLRLALQPALQPALGAGDSRVSLHVPVSLARNCFGSRSLPCQFTDLIHLCTAMPNRSQGMNIKINRRFTSSWLQLSNYGRTYITIACFSGSPEHNPDFISSTALQGFLATNLIMPGSRIKARTQKRNTQHLQLLGASVHEPSSPLRLSRAIFCNWGG